MDQSALISAVVKEVLAQLGSAGVGASRSGSGANGVFKSVNIVRMRKGQWNPEAAEGA